MSDKQKSIEAINTVIGRLDEAIEKIKNKDNKIIFYVPDSKGQARSSLINIVQQAETLIDLGYNAVLLYDSKEVLSPSSWGKTEWDEIPRFNVKDQILSIGAQDILVIPEIFANILKEKEVKDVMKVIYIQSHEHMLDHYKVGTTWTDDGVFDVITHSDTITKLVEEISHTKDIHVIEPLVGSEFKTSEMPKKPSIAIYSRDQRKSAKVIKQFLAKYPIYRWFSFRDAHGYTHENLPTLLGECTLSVWLDSAATYGRFPLEAIKCGTPVIGTLPDIPQEWMTSKNGIWVENDNEIADLVAAYIKKWIEDEMTEFDGIDKTVSTVATIEKHRETIDATYTSLGEKRISVFEKNIELYKEKIAELEAMDDEPQVEEINE